MNNQQNKSSYVIIIIMAVVIVVLCFALGWFMGGKAINKDNAEEKTNQVTNENQTKGNSYSDFVQTTKEARTNETIINETMGDYNLKIELASNGDVILNYNSVYQDKQIANNILKAFVVNSGQSDIGDNRSVVMIKEDGTLIALRFDYLIFNDEIKLITDFNNLKEVVDVYTESNKSNDYEPLTYTNYAKDLNNQVYDITNYLTAKN